MRKLLCPILLAGRARRGRAVGIALWLLRLVRDVEKEEMYRYSDELDKLDLEHESIPKRVYAALEEESITCEYVLGTLDEAIEDLEVAY